MPLFREQMDVKLLNVKGERMSNGKKSEMVKADSVGEAPRLDKAEGIEVLRRGFTDPKSLVSEGFDVEQQYTMEQGDEIRGVFDGEGASIEFTSDEGVVTTVKTWRIRAPQGGAVLNILGSAQLSHKLSSIAKGMTVVIQHRGQVELKGGKRANNYMVFTQQG